jgi:uncharacterized Zn-finger protein
MALSGAKSASFGSAKDDFARISVIRRIPRRPPGFPIMASVAAPAAKLVPANAENRYDVHRSDLPLSCPMPGMALWNSHPKVYLPVEAEGSAKCPYCGAVYTLKD